MEDWKIKNRVADIISQHINIPNGSVNKPYKAVIDLDKWGMNDITYLDWKGLEDVGLVYNADDKVIEGIPRISGDIKVMFVFKLQNDVLHEKPFNLIINPDPRSLWKEIPSDTTDQYWKEDDVMVADTLGDKQLVVISKRGRSHENVGAFRDDDFAYAMVDGWSIVAVADGAGSAKYSRRGAQLACKTVVDFFKEIPTERTDAIKLMYKAVLAAFEAIKAEGDKLEDFHTTLIFALFKKIGDEYVVMTFGVGDCPIVMMSADMQSVQLLNKMDVGQFGGGTRFLTQPEIYTKDMQERFNYLTVPDFSYLFLMTDGIYDPKFEVEANLEKLACWQQFIAELDLQKIDDAERLSRWADFWSPGNHDDRTLAIIY